MWELNLLVCLLKPDKSKGRDQTKRSSLVLQAGGWELRSVIPSPTRSCVVNSTRALKQNGLLENNLAKKRIVWVLGMCEHYMRERPLGHGVYILALHEMKWTVTRIINRKCDNKEHGLKVIGFITGASTRHEVIHF